MQRKSNLTKLCLQCGTPFRLSYGKRERETHHFCSRTCYFRSIAPPLDPLTPNIIKAATCWIFTGRIRPNGYGVLPNEQGVQESAHRYSYRIHYGVIPEGLFVLHRCDNKQCVNPDHLFLGNHSENMQDMVRKGRNHNFKGTHSTSSKLSEQQISDIRSLFAKGGISHVALAETYNVARSTIGAIIRRENWNHIP